MKISTVKCTFGTQGPGCEICAALPVRIHTGKTENLCKGASTMTFYATKVSGTNLLAINVVIYQKYMKIILQLLYITAIMS